MARKNNNKRTKEDACIIDEDSDSYQKSNQSQDSFSDLKNETQLMTFKKSTLINFHGSLQRFRNMKEMMDKVFKEEYNPEFIIDSLILFILVVSFSFKHN